MYKENGIKTMYIVYIFFVIISIVTPRSGFLLLLNTQHITYMNTREKHVNMRRIANSDRGML